MLGRPPTPRAGTAQDAAPLALDVLPRQTLGAVTVETAVVLVDRRAFLESVADLAEGRRCHGSCATVRPPPRHWSIAAPIIPGCRTWCRRALRVRVSMPLRDGHVK